MVFVYRQNLALPGLGLIPIRAYFHEKGFKEVFQGKKHKALGYTLDNVFLSEQYLDGSFDFFLIAVWGDEERNKILNVFCYMFDKEEWTSEGEIKVWNVINGVWTRKNEVDFCESFIDVAYCESKYRREKTKDLEDFVRNPISERTLRMEGLLL